MTTLVLLVVGVIGAMVLLAVVERVLDRPELGWWIGFVSAAAGALELPLRAEVAGIQITLADLGFVVLIAVVITRALRGHRYGSSQLLLTVALLMVLFSVARGTLEFELTAAVNEARETLYFVAAALFAATTPWDGDTRDRFVRAWMVYAAVLIGVFFLRIGIVVAGLPLLGAWYSPEFGGLRVIYANSAFVIAQAFLMLLPRVLRGDATRKERWGTIGLGVMVALTQHRSVWAVTLIAGCCVGWQYRRVMSRGFLATGLVLAGSLAVASVVVFDGGEIISQAGQTDAASTRTLEWRTSGWLDLIANSGPDDVLETLLGEPYGTGFAREVSAGFEVAVKPHNMYLELGLRIGLVGLFALVAAVAGTFRRLRRPVMEQGELLTDGALRVAILAIAIFALPYNAQLDQALLLGLAMSLVGNARRRPQPPPLGDLRRRGSVPAGVP